MYFDILVRKRHYNNLLNSYTWYLLHLAQNHCIQAIENITGIVQRFKFNKELNTLNKLLFGTRLPQLISKQK